MAAAAALESALHPSGKFCRNRFAKHIAEQTPSVPLRVRGTLVAVSVGVARRRQSVQLYGLDD